MKQPNRRQLKNEHSREDLWLCILKRIPDVFLVCSLGAIIVNDLLTKFFGVTFFNSAQVFVKLAAPIIISVVILLARILYDLRDDIRPLHRLASSVARVLPGEGSIACAKLMRTSSQIDVLTLSGSVMIPLEDAGVMAELNNPHRHSSVRCLMANPFSDAIKWRYAHDEPDWKENGVDAIEHRLCWLYNMREQLEPHARERLTVRVYDSYPMISLFRADEDIYTAYYGYKLRGNDTPCFHTDKSTYLGKSVLKHFDRLYDASQPLSQWVAANFSRFRRQEAVGFEQQYSGLFLQTNAGHFIFQRRDDKPQIANAGMLSVFGGRARKGESPRDVAVRELHEETGLRVAESALEHLCTFPQLDGNDEEACVLCTYYLVRDITPSDIHLREGQGVEVYTKEEVLDRPDLTRDPRSILSNPELWCGNS